MREVWENNKPNTNNAKRAAHHTRTKTTNGKFSLLVVVAIHPGVRSRSCYYPSAQTGPAKGFTRRFCKTPGLFYLLLLFYLSPRLHSGIVCDILLSFASMNTKNKGRHAREAASIFKRVANSGSHVLLSVDGGSPSQTISAWLFSPSHGISQISKQARLRMWGALAFVTRVQIKDKEMTLYRVRRVQAVDPHTRKRSKPHMTRVVVNPSLGGDVCILGMNTVLDLDIQVNFRAGKLHLTRDTTVAMLSAKAARLWSCKRTRTMHAGSRAKIIRSRGGSLVGQTTSDDESSDEVPVANAVLIPTAHKVTMIQPGSPQRLSDKIPVANAVPIPDMKAGALSPIPHASPKWLPVEVPVSNEIPVSDRTTSALSSPFLSPKSGSTRDMGTRFDHLTPAQRNMGGKAYAATKSQLDAYDKPRTDKAVTDTTNACDDQFPVPTGFAEAFEASLNNSQLAAEFPDLADNLVD